MKTLLGIPLRNGRLRDEEFIQVVNETIQKRKRMRIIWPIMSMVLLILFFSYLILFFNVTKQ